MRLVLFFFLSALFAACDAEPKKQTAVNRRQKDLQYETSEMHKQWIQEDFEAIEKFVSRRKWTMTETGTGTLYYVYQTNPDGQQGQTDLIATVGYEVLLLDGQVIYSSDQDGPAVVKIEKDDVESGLHEVLKLMRVGEKAAVILHPHRAHGLLGDTDKIGPQSVVVYNLHLIQLK
jgi:FKBP-type peptidyl-prolyl cis-trans isomerase FkpA